MRETWSFRIVFLLLSLLPQLSEEVDGVRLAAEPVQPLHGVVIFPVSLGLAVVVLVVEGLVVDGIACAWPLVYYGRRWLEHVQVFEGVLLYPVHLVLPDLLGPRHGVMELVPLVHVVVLVAVVRYVVGDLLLLADERLSRRSSWMASTMSLT